MKINGVIDVLEGVSKKTGKPYKMYRLYIPEIDDYIILNARVSLQHYKLILTYENELNSSRKE